MSKVLKKIIALSLVTMSALTFGQTVLVQAKELVPTKEEEQWLPEFTEKDREEQLKVTKLTEDVKLNHLGLERIKEYNSEDVVENIIPFNVGEEVIKEGESVAFVTENKIDNVVLPSNIDNSETKYFPNIDTQGVLSSCASFSTAYYTMTHMTALANDWSVKDESGKNINTRVFSPKWPYTFANGGTTGGSFAYTNYDVYRTHGCATMNDFPYIGTTGDVKNYRGWATDEKVWREATKYQVDDILRVDFNKEGEPDTFITSTNDSDLEKAKTLLLNGYILNMYTWISGTDNKKVANDISTSEDDKFVNQDVIYQVNNKGAHEMTIVGYNDDIWTDINSNGIVDNGEKGAFKIANSYGKNYGNNGFVWMTYDALNSKSSVLGFTNSELRNGAFLYNEAEYVTVIKKEAPSVLAQFTMQHDSRNELTVSLVYEENGVEFIKDYSPLLDNKGGSFPLDGINNGSEITFSIDVAHLEEAFDVRLDNDNKISLKIEDSLKNGKAAIVKSVKLVDADGKELSENIIQEPAVIDGASQTFELGVVATTGEPTLRKATILVDKFIINDGNLNLNVLVPSKNSAEKIKLYENNILVETKDIQSNTDSQNINFQITNKADGEYIYTAVLEDSKGISVSSEEIKIVVDSKDLQLIAPIFSVSPEESNDGVVTIEAVVPAFNSASVLKLYQNGQVIKIQKLTRGNQNDFKQTYIVDSLKDGIYTFWAELENETTGIISERVRIIVENKQVVPVELKAATISANSEVDQDGNVDLAIKVPANNTANTLKVYHNGEVIKIENLTTGNTNDVSISVPVNSLKNGTHNFWVEVSDETSTLISNRLSVIVEIDQEIKPDPPINTWKPNILYKIGDIVIYNGNKYLCTMVHTSLLGWEPSNVPALWSPIK